MPVPSAVPSAGTPALALLASLALCAVAAGQGADNCADAQVVKGYGAVPFDTTAATTDGLPDGLCNFFNNQQIFNDVWFRFVASETTVLEVSTCSQTGLDSKIAVYAGTDCASPVIACSDDNCSLQTKVSLAVTAGESYLVRLGGYGAANFGSGTVSFGPMGFLGDFTDPATGVRYVAVDGTSWSASEAFAQTLGGHLVSIGDAAEQEFVWQNFGSLGGTDRRIWIGFSDAAFEGVFEWSDGTPAKYTNWNGGEPNNSGGTEHYAEMLGSSGLWNDLNDAGAGYQHISVIELAGGGGSNPCNADLNDDGFVGAPDISFLLSSWGTPFADLTGDGVTDAQDLAALLDAWGDCP
ncbi:MAG: hypothetical protein RL136_1028 [Planctomycetota bacterium]|jgi:hypothetical protein